MQLTQEIYYNKQYIFPHTRSQFGKLTLTVYGFIRGHENARPKNAQSPTTAQFITSVVPRCIQDMILRFCIRDETDHHVRVLAKHFSCPDYIAKLFFEAVVRSYRISQYELTTMSKFSLYNSQPCLKVQWNDCNLNNYFTQKVINTYKSSGHYLSHDIKNSKFGQHYKAIMICKWNKSPDNIPPRNPSDYSKNNGYLTIFLEFFQTFTRKPR